MYGLGILHQCGKSVKTRNQKVLGANYYIRRSYRGKTRVLADDFYDYV